VDDQDIFLAINNLQDADIFYLAAQWQWEGKSISDKGI